jgi:hypothetical protein
VPQLASVRYFSRAIMKIPEEPDEHATLGPGNQLVVQKAEPI